METGKHKIALVQMHTKQDKDYNVEKAVEYIGRSG